MNCEEPRKITPVRMTGLDDVAAELCRPESLDTVLHGTLCDAPLPAYDKLKEILDRLKSVLFPGYFGPSRVHMDSLRYHVTANLDSIYRLLAEQIRRGGCFAGADYTRDCPGCETNLHGYRHALHAEAAGNPTAAGSGRAGRLRGRPAASSPGETVFCYPSMQTMIHHRIAHELYLLKVPVIPRIIAEMAHSATGIDIHPGASIGENFFIDHGTGVVIGETCIIGRGCRLYQGVTLGALSFQKADDGTLVKGLPRHPILEDNVTVYAGASILGRITIGTGSVIGGNVWLTRSVPAGSKIVQASGARAKPGELLGKKETGCEGDGARHGASCD